MFMLGFACQRGGLPLSAEAVEKAIELNGQAVQMNVAAFRWGRRAAHDFASVERLVLRMSGGARRNPVALSLDEMIARRTAFLTAYQNAAYAGRFAERIGRLRDIEDRVAKGSTALTEAAARSLFKLMAVKDEYEVARLYTDGSFRAQLADTFEGYDRLEFHLAPPMLGRRDGQGRPRKSRFGPWMMHGFRLLVALRGLRGTVFDLFGHTAERRAERRLLEQFEADLDRIEARVSAGRLDAATALASVPMLVRGYGHVRSASMMRAKDERARLIERFENEAPQAELQAAE